MKNDMKRFSLSLSLGILVLAAVAFAGSTYVAPPGATVTFVDGAVVGTLTMSGVATDITTGSNEDLTLSPNGTGDLRLGLDSGTSLYSSTTFSLDSSGNVDASGYANFSYFKAGTDPADAGSLRLANNGSINWEAATPGADWSLYVGADDILHTNTSLTVDGDAAVGGALTMTAGGTIQTTGTGTLTIAPAGTGDLSITLDADTLLYAVGFTLDATGNVDASGYANFSYSKFGADPADAGAIRMSNATYIMAEADAAGTDISVIGVDSGEIIQIGASGASGVTVTPALTVTGALHLNGTIINLGATGVNITSDNDGAITFLGQSAGNDEDLTWNFDDGTANSVTVSTASAVDTINWSAIGHTTTGTVKAGTILSTPAAAQTIAAGEIIAADSCGGLKTVTASGAVATDTTHSITAPAAANTGCCMDIYNSGAEIITIDTNTTIVVGAAANLALGPKDIVRFCSNGTNWLQVTALLSLD